jgi:hypothetical protein
VREHRVSRLRNRRRDAPAEKGLCLAPVVGVVFEGKALAQIGEQVQIGLLLGPRNIGERQRGTNRKRQGPVRQGGTDRPEQELPRLGLTPGDTQPLGLDAEELALTSD